MIKLKLNYNILKLFKYKLDQKMNYLDKTSNPSGQFKAGHGA